MSPAVDRWCEVPGCDDEAIDRMIVFGGAPGMSSFAACAFHRDNLATPPALAPRRVVSVASDACSWPRFRLFRWLP